MIRSHGVDIRQPRVTRLCLGIKDAAAVCDLDYWGIYVAIHSGQLLAKRTGRDRTGPWWNLDQCGTGRYLIKVSDLEEWFAQRYPDRDPLEVPSFG